MALEVLQSHLVRCAAHMSDAERERVKRCRDAFAVSAPGDSLRRLFSWERFLLQKGLSVALGECVEAERAEVECNARGGAVG
jgi:hypothetical protein